MAMTRIRARLANEDGTALIIALMAMMLLTALGAAVVMVSRTETAIANNYRNSQEALYAADAAVERVVQDLLMVPRWNDILRRRRCSPASSTAPGPAPKTLPGGGTITLLRPTATGELQAETDTAEPVGRQQSAVAAVRLGAARATCSTTTDIDSPMYVAVWVADDPADGPTRRRPTAIRCSTPTAR